MCIFLKSSYLIERCEAGEKVGGVRFIGCLVDVFFGNGTTWKRQLLWSEERLRRVRAEILPRLESFSVAGVVGEAFLLVRTCSSRCLLRSKCVFHLWVEKRVASDGMIGHGHIFNPGSKCQSDFKS